MFSAYIDDDSANVGEREKKRPPWSRQHFNDRVVLQVVETARPDNILYTLDPTDINDPQNIFMVKNKKKKAPRKQKHKKKSRVYQHKKIRKKRLVTPNTLNRKLRHDSVDSEELDLQRDQIESKRSKKINTAHQRIAHEKTKQFQGIYLMFYVLFYVYNNDNNIIRCVNPK